MASLQYFFETTGQPQPFLGKVRLNASIHKFISLKASTGDVSFIWKYFVRWMKYSTTFCQTATLKTQLAAWFLNPIINRFEVIDLINIYIQFSRKSVRMQLQNIIFWKAPGFPATPHYSSVLFCRHFKTKPKKRQSTTKTRFLK